MPRRTKRRQLLLGLGGVAVGLPFLETFAPQKAAAQAASVPKRLAIFFCCNGVNAEKWYPTGDFGALTAESFAGSSLEPIAAHAARALVVRGLYGAPRGQGRDPGPGDDHERGLSCRLTASPLADTEEKYAQGPSLDHVVAKAVNPGGKGPLNLMVGVRYPGARGGISYTAAGQQASPFQDPWKAFRDWVGADSEAPEADAALQRAAQRRQSVLDLVHDELEALKNNPAVSQQDRQKLDLHFSSIRDVEVGMASAGLTSCTLPEARRAEIQAIVPATVTRDTEYQKIGGMMMDVMALALACGQNRVATLQWGCGALGPIFSWLPPLGYNDTYSHHKLSHGSSSDMAGELGLLPHESWKEAITNIDRWYAQQLASLVDRLVAYTEPGGSLLDNMSLLYMNDVADGYNHGYMDLPCLLFGSCQGYFKQGQHVRLTTGARIANDVDAPSNMLLTTLANSMGLGLTDFGSAPTGKPGELGALKA